MTARITKSRDPILAALRATLAAVRADALSYPHDGDFIHAYALARKAVTEREALFCPKRIRKAERKAGEIDRIVRYVSAKPIFFRNHVPTTGIAIAKAERAAHYRAELMVPILHIYCGDGRRGDLIKGHREAMQ